MTHFIQASSLFLFLCVVALVAGCDNKPPRPKTEALTEQVKTALVRQAGVDADAAQLEIESNAGVVRIKGQVDSDETKQRVHEAAKKVPGVKWVQDQTSVAPSAPVPSAK
jgi:osmotically-inducible protein OsmY